MKKIVFILFLFFCSINNVFASGLSGVMLGDKYYTNLVDAISDARDGDIITLLSDAFFDKEILINKNIIIDLNGNNISSNGVVFYVNGGNLTIKGKGVLRENNPNYGAIKVVGSSSLDDKEYSVVNVYDGVVLEGWSGIFITHDKYKSYGVLVNFDGDINAVSDNEGGKGIGIYVNGNIQEQNNYPIINVLDNATIKSNGLAFYLAGYADTNISGGYFEGVEASIGIKSGILHISGGEFICNGDDETPTVGNNNGILASGTTLQIESNSGYAGDVEIDISSGKFVSKESNVIYEYIGKGNDTTVKSINISDGDFISNSGKNVFLFSDSFKNKHTNFVNGGFFSSNPSDYVKLGYTVKNQNDGYYVSDSLKSVFKEDGGVSFFKVILVIGCGVFGLFLFLVKKFKLII